MFKIKKSTFYLYLQVDITLLFCTKYTLYNQVCTNYNLYEFYTVCNLYKVAIQFVACTQYFYNISTCTIYFNVLLLSHKLTKIHIYYTVLHHQHTLLSKIGNESIPYLVNVNFICVFGHMHWQTS